MIIGVPCDAEARETRVAATPATAAKLVAPDRKTDARALQHQGHGVLP